MLQRLLHWRSRQDSPQPVEITSTLPTRSAPITNSLEIDSLEIATRPTQDLTPVARQLLDTQNLPLGHQEQAKRFEEILKDVHRNQPRDFPWLLNAMVFPETGQLGVEVPEEIAWKTVVQLQSHPEWLNRPFLEKLALKQDPTGEVNYTSIAVKELLARGEHTRLQPLLLQMVVQDQKNPSGANAWVRQFCTILAHQPEGAINKRQLWDLSKEISRLLPEGDTGRIEDFSEGMLAAKATTRDLQDYKMRLNLSDNDLQALNHKKLCLAGGGYSPIKRGLQALGIACHITNIDPICTTANPENEDRKVPNNFFGATVGHLLQREKFDEIWALNSLPQYALSPQETLQVYTRALSGLVRQGTLRVAPYRGFADTLGPAMTLSRPIVNQVSQEVLEALAEHPKLFNVQHFTISHKGFWGRRPMDGVSIQVVGKPRAVEKFLQRELPARIHSLCD